MLADVDIDDLWKFAEKAPLLCMIEGFLTNAGDTDLSKGLNRLQQDIALQITDRMGRISVGDEPKTDGTLWGMEAYLKAPNSDGSFSTAPTDQTKALADQYQPVTHERILLVVGAVARALERHNAPPWLQLPESLAPRKTLSFESPVVVSDREKLSFYSP